MNLALDDYLNKVLAYANRKQPDADRIRAELEDHFENKIADLKKQGFSPEDATFKAIQENGSPQKVGYSLRKFSLVDVRSEGTARGVIAIGPKAVGFVAIGGTAVGLFAFGGLAIGLMTIGGFALGLLFGFGGFALSPAGLAYGGFALGLLAYGGFSLGVLASGAYAFGLWVPAAAQRFSYYTADNVPKWLEGFGDAFLSSSNMLAEPILLINITIAALFLMFGLMSVYFNKKEKNRLSQADPDIAE